MGSAEAIVSKALALQQHPLEQLNDFLTDIRIFDDFVHHVVDGHRPSANVNAFRVSIGEPLQVRQATLLHDVPVPPEIMIRHMSS